MHVIMTMMNTMRKVNKQCITTIHIKKFQSKTELSSTGATNKLSDLFSFR